jgi:hypothetical protein
MRVTYYHSCNLRYFARRCTGAGIMYWCGSVGFERGGKSGDLNINIT